MPPIRSECEPLKEYMAPKTYKTEKNYQQIWIRIFEDKNLCVNWIINWLYFYFYLICGVYYVLCLKNLNTFEMKVIVLILSIKNILFKLVSKQITTRLKGVMYIFYLRVWWERVFNDIQRIFGGDLNELQLMTFQMTDFTYDLRPFRKSKFNLMPDRVNLVAPASPIECPLYFPMSGRYSTNWDRKG